MSHHHHNHSHCEHEHHDHNHASHHHHHGAFNDLRYAFVLNLLFTIFEFAAGIYTNSMAILSDAVHDLGDTFAIGASLGFEKYSAKGRDATYSYGYRRFSPFAALLNGIVLLSGSVVMIIHTIPRFWEHQSVKIEFIAPVAVIGIIFNGLAVIRLKNSTSISNRTVMLHLMEDLLGWVAVFIGGIVMYLTGWLLVDAILSILISVYILYNAFQNLKKVFVIFMQAVPQDIDFEIIKEEIGQIQHVIDVHDVHSWSLDGQYHIMSLHITVVSGISIEEVIQIKKKSSELIGRHGVEHPTISIDFEGEECNYKLH